MESYKPLCFPEHTDSTHDLRCKWNHLLLKNKNLLEPSVSLGLKSTPVPMARRPCRPLQPSPRLPGHSVPSLLSWSPFHPHNALPARFHVRGTVLARKIYLRVSTKLCLFLIVQRQLDYYPASSTGPTSHRSSPQPPVNFHITYLLSSFV